MPGTGFYDLSRHHRWATETLLTFCEQLDSATLGTIVPGTFGSILETMQHLVDSDVSYILRVTGAWPDHPWRDNAAVDLATLRERSNLADSVLIDFLDGDWDVDAISLAYGDDDAVFEVPAGVFITQAFHHANEHRAQVCTALGTLGIEPPDISAWEFSAVSDRSTQVS